MLELMRKPSQWCWWGYCRFKGNNDRVSIANVKNVIDFFLLSTLYSLISLIYPRLIALHTISGETGKLIPDTTIVNLPPPLNLSSEKLDRRGVYLVEDGESMILWVAKLAPPELIQAIFGKWKRQFIQNELMNLPIDWLLPPQEFRHLKRLTPRNWPFQLTTMT